MPGFVAFDVDGTLIASDHVHYAALDAALHDVAGFTLTPAEHVALRGLPTRDKLAKLVYAERLTTFQATRVLEAKQSYTVPAIDALPYTPGPRDLLLTLRRAGFRLCAVSNAVDASVRAMLRAARVETLVEFMLSNESAAPKPAPDLYLLAARRFGIAPEELVVVEDGAPGIVAAVRAGCTVVAINGVEDVTPSLMPRIVLAGLRAAIIPSEVVRA